MLGSYIFGWLSDKCGRKLSFFVSIILQVKQKKLVASKQILRALDLKSTARPCLEFSLAWFPTTGLLFSSGWWWARWRWSSCIEKIEDDDHHVSTKLMTLMMNLAQVGATTSGVFLVAYVLAMEMVGPQYRFDSIMTLSALAWIKSVMIKIQCK